MCDFLLIPCSLGGGSSAPISCLWLTQSQPQIFMSASDCVLKPWIPSGIQFQLGEASSQHFHEKTNKSDFPCYPSNQRATRGERNRYSSHLRNSAKPTSSSAVFLGGLEAVLGKAATSPSDSSSPRGQPLWARTKRVLPV